jgi:hypothetical protein
VSFSVEQRLADALAECERLRVENQQLRERCGLPQVETAAQSTANTVEFDSTSATVTSKSSSDEKVKLFRSLFRGREDVYATRWEGRNGKTGYSPAHRKIWSNSFQKRPDEPKEYFPLTDQVIHDHLTGKLTAEHLRNLQIHGRGLSGFPPFGREGYSRLRGKPAAAAAWP